MARGGWLDLGRLGGQHKPVAGAAGGALRRYVMAAGKLHADDTPVPVLAPGNGKTGRLWTYVRDDRPAGDTAAPAVWFAYSPDRKEEHPEGHLREFRGTLQADAYAGFNQLYENGRIQQAACWSHVHFGRLLAIPCCCASRGIPDLRRAHPDLSYRLVMC